MGREEAEGHTWDPQDGGVSPILGRMLFPAQPWGTLLVLVVQWSLGWQDQWEPPGLPALSSWPLAGTWGTSTAASPYPLPAAMHGTGRGHPIWTKTTQKELLKNLPS